MQLTPTRVFLASLFAAIMIINLVSLEEYPAPHCDEAVYANISQTLLREGHFGSPILGETAGLDQNHVFSGRMFHILQAPLIAVFGYSVWTVRLFAAIGWGLVGLFIYQIVKKLVSLPAAIVSTLVYLVSLNSLFASHNGRAETWVAASVMGTLWYYLTVAESQRWYEMAALGMLLSVSAVGFHVNGIFFTAALGMVILYQQFTIRRPAVSLLPLFVAGLLTTALFVYLTLIPDPALALFQAGSLNVGTGSGLALRLQELLGWLNTGFVTGINGLVIPLTVYALMSILLLLFRKKPQIKMLTIIGGGALILSFIVTSYRTPFYYALWDPFIATIIGVAVVEAGEQLYQIRPFERFRPGSMSAILIAPLILVNIAAWTYLSIKFHPRDYQGYVADVQQFISPNAMVMGDAIFTYGFNGRNPFISDWSLTYRGALDPEFVLTDEVILAGLQKYRVEYAIVDGTLSCSSIPNDADRLYTAVIAETCLERGRVDNPWFGTNSESINSWPTVIYYCGQNVQYTGENNR